MKRPVKGYEGLYSVDTSGIIYGRKDQPLKPFDNGKGYMVVVLHDGTGGKQHKRVHRIVAEAFIPNPEALPEINHKDENKGNNDVFNLEWCTSSYNKRYGSGRIRRSEGMKRYWAERRAG